MQATHDYWCPLITSKLKSLKFNWCLYWYVTQLYSLHCFHRQISSQRFSYIFIHIHVCYDDDDDDDENDDVTK